LNMGRTINW